VQTEVNKLDAQIDRLNDRIAVTQTDLERTQIRLAFIERELQATLSKLDKRTDAFTERAVAAYMAGPNAYLEGLVSSTTFNELTDRLSYYEAALDADSELVEDIELLRDETQIKRGVVEEKEAEIAQKKLKLEQDKSAVAAVRTERATKLAYQTSILEQKESALGKVLASKREQERIVAQLEADASEIQQLLAARQAGYSGPLPTGGGQLLWPASGPVTSGYGYRTHPIFGDGRMHTGIDIGASYGAPVISADAGTVAYVGAMSGYGNVVVIDHGGGLATTYNHLSAFGVSSGQSVGRGVYIANVGCTGYCTGPHLHFEVRINGSPVDPLGYL
jgi:murein DD-endopeptidase MepM/ murein hydrolase activator NlpD